MELKRQILSAARRVEPLALPELNLTAYVRAMTGAEADTYEAALEAAEASKSTVGLAPLLTSLTLCDEKGELIFKNDKEAGEMDARAITRIVHAARKINGLTKEFRDELEKKVQPESKDVGSA